MQRIRFDESLVGTVVEKDFTIVEYLGAGAMGATYRARQLSLSRDVCIKFLAVSSLSDPENVRRFKREARVLARLKHKNIVECYAFGIFERVYPYLVMELVSGQSLRRVLQDGALDWARSCKIVLQASDALHSAHLQGIVHRDVKPDNLMLCGEGVSESVKVIDFGLAGKIGAVDGFETLTSPGKIFGTPNYMPPEAFSGAAGAAGDIYALGCVLHECVSGVRPFDADSPVAVMNNKLTQVLPSFNRSIEPTEVRIALDEIVRRATEKKASDRFATCAHLSHALAEAGIAPHLVPLSARPPIPGNDRKPVMLVSIALLVFVAMSIPLVLGTLSRRTHGTGKLDHANVWSEVASKIGSPALSPPAVDVTAVHNELVSLTATARDLTDRRVAFKLNGLQKETRLFFCSVNAFTRKNGRFLEQTSSLQPQVSALCLALTDLAQALPPTSTVLRYEIVNSQSDLLTAYGCFSGAAKVLETKAALPRTFVIAQNSPDILAQMHHALGMRMEKTGDFIFAKRLRPAVHRYAQLPDGTKLFLECLRWNRTGCSQLADAGTYDYSLFAVAKDLTVKDRTVALKALADMIHIEASGGHVEQARTAMEVLRKNYPQPTPHEVIEFADLMVALKWDKKGEQFLEDARDHARRRHDDFGFCLLESARLKAFGASHSDVVQQCSSFGESPSWAKEKLKWTTFSMVLSDLISLTGDCKRSGKTSEARILLQQCQTMLLAEESRLYLKTADAPSVEGYGSYLYHLAELSLNVQPEEERRTICETYLKFMEKNGTSFPDGFFPFAARAHMAHYLFVSGNQPRADVLFRWCDEHLQDLFRTCRTGGWQNWVSVHGKWFREAGYSRTADAIDKEVARRPMGQ